MSDKKDKGKDGDLPDTRKPSKRQRISHAPTSRRADKPFLGPSVNAKMHGRSLYKTKNPDFEDLASKYEDFRPFVFYLKNGSPMIDFRNPAAVRAYNRALLEDDFDLKVELPENRLVPTLPNRLNYIHWLEDILQEDGGKQEDVTGIDIGTGASCIYPLLGCKMNSWKFLATEIDKESMACARRNVEKNDFEEDIKLITVDNPASVLCGVIDGDSDEYKDVEFDFCMCNPPFFESHEQRGQDVHRAGRVATNNETVCPGGELGFIKQIIEDSLVLRGRIRWYTSMIGRKSTLASVERLLREAGVSCVRTGRFYQGRTARWAIGWKI